MPHRDNCNAFFACSGNQQQTLLNCAPGLHFDHERQLCDLPRSSRCWARENPPIPGQQAEQSDNFPPGGGDDDDLYPPMKHGKPGFGQLPPGVYGPQLPPGFKPGKFRPRSGLTDVEDAEITPEISLED